MHRRLFLKIVKDVEQHDICFTHRANALGNSGLRGIQKITSSLRILAYVRQGFWCQWQIHPNWWINGIKISVSILWGNHPPLQKRISLISKQEGRQVINGNWEGPWFPWHARFNWLHALGMEKLSYNLAWSVSRERKVMLVWLISTLWCQQYLI
jgi:hypothetical protein